MPTDHEFVTPSEKTQCQVQGKLPQCSHTKEGGVKRQFPTEEAFLQNINQFKEKTKVSSVSLIRKKLRDKFMKNKETIYSQKQPLKS